MNGVLVHDPFLVESRIFKFFNSCFYFKLLLQSKNIKHADTQPFYSREPERNHSCCSVLKGGRRDTG